MLSLQLGQQTERPPIAGLQGPRQEVTILLAGLGEAEVESDGKRRRSLGSNVGCLDGAKDSLAAAFSWLPAASP